MSIEAITLTTLLQRIDEANRMIEPVNSLRHILWAAEEAKFRIQPLQTLMNRAYATWEQNPNWSRDTFIEHLAQMKTAESSPEQKHQDVIDDYTLTAVVVGNLNYHVERDGGFEYWYKEIGPNKTDWLTLNDICEQLKTPVGYNAQGIIRFAGNRLVRLQDQMLRGGESIDDLRDDLRLASISYRSQRVKFLIEVENLMREKIEYLSHKP